MSSDFAFDPELPTSEQGKDVGSSDGFSFCVKQKVKRPKCAKSLRAGLAVRV